MRIKTITPVKNDVLKTVTTFCITPIYLGVISLCSGGSLDVKIFDDSFDDTFE